MRKTWGIAAAALATCGAVLLGPTSAGASPPAAAPAGVTATVQPTYRYGAMPRRGASRTTSPAAANDSTDNLTYGGGTSVNGVDVGVTTGHEKVYLVFWGTQWGKAGTDADKYVTFAGDPDGMAPVLQAFFDGLGTDAETWSGVMTQYCEGVAAGSQTCGTSDPHVAYPSGGALAGIWEDTAGAAPAESTAGQIATEAEAAAGHFGNTTQAPNRDTQYVVVSPHDTNPDDWQAGQFCAWHDYTTGTYGALAYTNLPYIPDAGYSCGANFVNSDGPLDGVTIVEGHEYAETITDQFPAGGWLDSSQNEAADKCIWILSTEQGGATDIALATGSFPVQAIWANDDAGGSGGCETSHPDSTGAPGAPGAPVVTPGATSVAGDGQVHLSFTAAAPNAAPVSAYTVVPRPACTTCRGLVLGGGTTATTVTGLTPGVPYSFSVYGSNADGSGLTTGMSKAQVTTTVPGEPRNLDVVVAPDADVFLGWLAPSAASGLPVERYLVEPAPDCPNCGVVVDGTHATVTGLRRGEHVSFTVRAVDGDGDSPVVTSRQVVVDLGSGYWLATAAGRVFGSGDAVPLGGIAALSSAPVVGIVATPDGRGYLLVTSNGTVAAFGDATDHGDLPARGVAVGDIVAIAPTVDGGGYWLIGADGGLFAFGDARYHGSLPARDLQVADVVGIVAAPSGAGYLLIGADGGVFAFGAAHYYGSLPGLGVVVHDVVAILPSATARGYVLVGADGGAFVFGSGARYFGSLPSKGVVVHDIVGLALSPDGGGYLMAGADGSVFGFGDAVVYPRPAGVTTAGRVAAIAGV